MNEKNLHGERGQQIIEAVKARIGREPTAQELIKELNGAGLLTLANKITSKSEDDRTEAQNE